MDSFVNDGRNRSPAEHVGRIMHACKHAGKSKNPRKDCHQLRALRIVAEELHSHHAPIHRVIARERSIRAVTREIPDLGTFPEGTLTFPYASDGIGNKRSYAYADKSGNACISPVFPCLSWSEPEEKTVNHKGPVPVPGYQIHHQIKRPNFPGQAVNLDSRFQISIHLRHLFAKKWKLFPFSHKFNVIFMILSQT